MGYIIGAAFCFFVAVFNIATGGLSMPGGVGALLVYIGIGVLLIYLYATVEKRAAKKREKLRQKQINEATLRFGDSSFVAMVLRDMEICRPSSVDVLKAELRFSGKTYVYSAYGLENLDVNGCKSLALYLGNSFFREQWGIGEISHWAGGFTGGYSGYIGSDGTAHLSPDYDGDEIIDGYSVYKPTPIPPVQPKQKW